MWVYTKRLNKFETMGKEQRINLNSRTNKLYSIFIERKEEKQTTLEHFVRNLEINVHIFILTIDFHINFFDFVFYFLFFGRRIFTWYVTLSLHFPMANTHICGFCLSIPNWLCDVFFFSLAFFSSVFRSYTQNSAPKTLICKMMIIFVVACDFLFFFSVSNFKCHTPKYKHA